MRSSDQIFGRSTVTIGRLVPCFSMQWRPNSMRPIKSRYARFSLTYSCVCRNVDTPTHPATCAT